MLWSFLLKDAQIRFSVRLNELLRGQILQIVRCVHFLVFWGSDFLVWCNCKRVYAFDLITCASETFDHNALVNDYAE